MQQTMTIRGREYSLFETYAHVDVAQRVAAELRKGGDKLVHVAKRRGNNAIYVHRFN
jgi:DNA-binding IclR family transcriptional regulator